MIVSRDDVYRVQHSRRRLMAGLVGGLALVCLFSSASGESPCPRDLDGLRKLCGDGALAYTADGRIYLCELSTGETTQVGNGDQPEFSPDGSKLAWIDGTNVKGRMRKGDSTIHTIATGVDPAGGVHWISDTEVVAVLGQGRKKEWHRVSLSGERLAVPELTKLGTGGGECDVKLDADGVWTYVIRVQWKTSDGRGDRLPGTCSVSLSPDGKYATSLHTGHKRCSLSSLGRGGTVSILPWNFSDGFDNHRWSSNDARFLVVMDENSDTPAVITADGRFATLMGQRGKARSEMYGDFTVGDGAGPVWLDAGDVPLAEGVLPAWPPETGGLVFLWENAIQSNTITSDGNVRTICRVLPRRFARLDRFHDMDLAQGCFLTESVTNERLLDAWQKTNQLTIEALITPRRGNDETSSAILSFYSDSGTPYQFIVGQKGDALAFRIQTDPQQPGGRPLMLCALEDETPQHVIVTCATDGKLSKLVCHKNGEQVFQTELSGSFASWADAQLVFGDPTTGKYDWSGRLEGVAFYDRFLDDDEAQRHYAAYQARVEDREPVPNLVVDAALMTKRPIPQVAQYPDALVVYDYSIGEVHVGEYAEKKLLVAHWGALNGQLREPVANMNEGSIHRLVLERFEDHPELKTIMIVENLDDFDLPLFLDVTR